MINKSAIFLLVFIGVLLFLIFKYVPEEQSSFVAGIAASLTVFGKVALLYLMKKRSGGEYQPPENAQTHDDENDYHNDFTKVPSSSSRQFAPRPIDLSGNVFEHNIQTIKEDLTKIGLNVKK